MRTLCIAAFVASALALAPAPAPALCQTFTDRVAWEDAVLAAGLDVVTEMFVSDPGSPFTMEDVDFTYFGNHSASRELIENSGTLNVNFTGGGSDLFGMGVDWAQDVGDPGGTVHLLTEDVNDDNCNISVFIANEGGAGFLGVLNDAPLDPANQGSPQFGAAEFRMIVQITPTKLYSFDDFSVAVMPEPGAPLGLGVCAAALAGLARRRR